MKRKSEREYKKIIPEVLEIPVFLRCVLKTGMMGEKIANPPPLQSRAGWKGKEVKIVRK